MSEKSLTWKTTLFLMLIMRQEWFGNQPNCWCACVCICIYIQVLWWLNLKVTHHLSSLIKYCHATLNKSLKSGQISQHFTLALRKVFLMKDKCYDMSHKRCLWYTNNLYFYIVNFNIMCTMLQMFIASFKKVILKLKCLCLKSNVLKLCGFYS